MRQTLYGSRARLENEVADIADILACANRNNPELGINGMLIHLDGWFLQLLEGPHANVAALLDCIRSDPRHCDMVIMADRTPERPLCSGWAMEHYGPVENGPDDGILCRMVAHFDSPDDVAPPTLEEILQAIQAVGLHLRRNRAG